MGRIVNTGLLSITAVGGGVGAVTTNAITAFTPPTGRSLIIRRIWFRNRCLADGNLLIGYGDRNVASLFRQVFPSIFMVAGVDGGIDPMPLCGNAVYGFVADTTALTGTTGAILIETDIAGVAAAPNDVQVVMDIEIIP